MKRRKVIKLGLAGGLATTAAAVLYKWKYLRLPISSGKQQFISAYVDLLIPADEISPGALDLGVDAELVERVNRNRSLRYLLHEGFTRLNLMAESLGGEAFTALSRDNQSRCIHQSEQAHTDSTENRLFRMMRRNSFDLYYVKPAAFQGLCFSGPPQPVGHMDYAEPPVGCM